MTNVAVYFAAGWKHEAEDQFLAVQQTFTGIIYEE